MKIVIIIPTYNEVDNIGRLIDALQHETATLAHDIHILVVDDNSPDGTADSVREKMSGLSTLHLITGEKKGLGNAYIRGMRHALSELGADAVFEMDADFSHKPEDVPRMIAALEQGADFVIGSRYVKGGSIPSEWGFMRKLNSRGGNFVARYVAGLYRVRDCTAGFRAIRADVLRRIDLGTLRIQGYAFQVTLLNQAMVEGARIQEIPVDFIDRTFGESKLGLSDIIEFVINAWWIRLQSSATFIKFAVVGLSGVAVNLLAFTALLELGVGKYISSPVAIEVSIVTNFLLNNYWTFKQRNTRERTRIKGLKFNIVSILTLAISYATFVILTLAYPEVAPQWHQALSIIPGMLSNYFLNSYWTFRHVPDVE